MLSSKANAALARLKEIEEKYKMKRNEQKWREDADSSISSVSIVAYSESRESSRKSPKPKLDIKMPDTRLEGRTETKLSPDRASARSPKDVDEVGFGVAVPLNDKSSHSVGKEESLISNATTIQENSLIESVLDDSVTPSKSLSRSKTSRRNSSTARPSRRERMRTQTARSERRTEPSGKSSEISSGKVPVNNTSISKRLRLSGKSYESPRVRLGPKVRSVEVKVDAETSEGDSKDSESLRDDAVAEESVGITENGSDIISEFSRAEESFVDKIEDSVDGSKHPTDENASENPKDLLAENGYANDTFEDISSSTVQSQREEVISGRKEVVHGTRSRKVDVASHQSSAEEYRDGPVITVDLTPKSSAIRIDSKNQRRRYQHREASLLNDSVSSATSLSKNTSEVSKSTTGNVTKTDEKKNSPRMTVRQESGRNEREEASNEASRERALIDVTGVSVASDKDWTESTKSNSLLEENEERRKDASEESLNQRISQDVEYVLRKSHEDATSRKHASLKAATNAPESSSASKSASTVRSASKTRKVLREEDKSCRPSENNKVSNHNCCEHHLKRRKKRARSNSKAVGTLNSTGSRKEDKASRFDGKQMRGLRKRIVELRLRQEREELQKYLHELKDLRLESASTRSYFKPLEFPKIAEFTQPDINDLESKPDDRFRERVFAIRHWLKDQYVLYRDYCTMAQAINANYVPTTLDDAKKTIRELRKTTIKTR